MDDFVSAVTARRTAIAQEMERLKAEDLELETAMGVFLRLGQRTGPTTSPADAHTPRTQKELVLEALKSSTKPWLQSKELALSIKNRWGIDISESSLRPLLTGLKNSKVIVRSGRLVALRDRYPIETPTRTKRSKSRSYASS